MFPVSRFLSIDAATTPSFTPNGGLVYLRDTTGTPQAWYRADAASDPQRLTAESERFSTVVASPTREEFVFGMDAGSDERDQLFRYNLDTGEQHTLTDDLSSIHLWGGWSPDGDRIAFTANRRDPQTFDVYVQERLGDPDSATLVREGDGGFLSIEGWSPDGNRLLATKARSSNAQDVFVISIADGTQTKLNRDDTTRYESAMFGPNSAIYCLTDEPSDTLVLARMDPDTSQVATVVDGGDWNVDGFDLDRSTGTIAYTRNVDGYSTLHLGRLSGDGTSVDVTAEPALEEAVIESVTVSNRGERYAIAHSSRSTPHSIAVGSTDPGDGESVRPQPYVPVGTLGILEERFRSPETIRYETFDGRDIPAYWTLPADASTGETPVIVDIHGGPHHQRRPWFYPIGQYFLQQGYAIFEPNVRGSSGYGTAYTRLDDVDKRLNSVRDIRAAVEWLAEQPAVDSDRIVAYGRSYGGFMVLSAISRYPDLWRAAVEFVGIADFETFLENTGEWRRSHREAEYGSLDTDRDVLQEISPIHDVAAIDCPLFIQHGANDPRVPVGETEQIAEALRSRDVPVETLIFEDEGHHTTDRSNLIEEFEQVAGFLDRHVQ